MSRYPQFRRNTFSVGIVIIFAPNKELFFLGKLSNQYFKRFMQLMKIDLIYSICNAGILSFATRRTQNLL